MKNLLVICLVVALLVSCKKESKYVTIPEKPVPELVSYNFDVRPILSDKCFNCHGPDANKRFADLRLDTPDGAYATLKDNKNQFVIVPHKPKESQAFLRITSKDTSEVMPPLETNLKLTAYEKKVIKKWIKQGATYEKHWAFQTVKKPELPQIEHTDWVNNEIDYFVLEKQKENSLTPNNRADKSRLLKRVSFDITGLPPTVEMQQRFLEDTSPNAYEKIIDELLASKHYGEKMASHWMDVSRYADSHGFQDDDLRTMWPWRDWVIHAFNENYGYDTFVTYQLAGDLMPERNVETLLATGFNRNNKVNQEAGIIVEEFRIEDVTDRTNTFGKAFLGLTYECAKCHDHKYDPISQKDYYSAFAFFDKTPYKNSNKNNNEGLRATAEPPYLSISDEIVATKLPFINKESAVNVDVMVVEEEQVDRTTHVLERGVYDAKGDIVTPDTPEAILAFDKAKYSENRLGLSKWLFDEKNPLTSRVFVNRVWQEIFGKGIVKTSGDFGMQGNLPTHVGLLNWLSADLMEHNWDMKRLVKTIVMSSTYQQSSVISPEKLALDPDNKYLSWSPRLRFTSEMVRDHVLASSGLLNNEIGGRSIKIYQPDGLWEASSSGRGFLSTYARDTGDDLYKRGLYIFTKRTSMPPVQMIFDATSRDQCEVRRQSTSTPLQALIVLNDPTILEASRVFSQRLNEKSNSVEDNIDFAFKSILCRNIKSEEKALLVSYYKEKEVYFSKAIEKANQFINVGEYPLLKDGDSVKIAALMQVIHTIYNMEEAIVKS
ncbi:PSD1 and planctomycete cytochrome C domain-containing protein [Flavivirga amylovorans]|uniref:PSD1 and planctomycete cytochrome C domain-containing protein n=1 Tax=Flavivirga amylovorans TaxID=870486 RepID=A0ABT8WWX7_9FLAO|nr:PSD1 and planctomycete cytochrome C domain-containing protein [Flavivirga amylovorans]MDO5986189.1 PSD1 and planctomycete cytochrome C domain-containing protein [Flavivirga amylovorans]